MQKEIIKRKIFTAKIRTHLANKQWETLIKLFSGAEDAKVSVRLLTNLSKRLGEYLVSNNRYHEAIIFSNKSRIRDPKNKSTFELFTNAVLRFFNENVEEFSKKDLEEYRQVILPIIEFHKFKYSAHRVIVDSTEQMFRRIDYRIKYVAKDVQESKITFRVQQIKNSLYGNMTFEEVQKEFARLLSPKLREILAEKEEDEEAKKKDNKKKSTRKKKKDK